MKTESIAKGTVGLCLVLPQKSLLDNALNNLSNPVMDARSKKTIPPLSIKHKQCNALGIQGKANQVIASKAKMIS